MAQSFGPKSSANSGNIFFALFGAIALIGILGAGVMTFMKGPLATSVKLTRQNTAENQMNIAGQVAVMASAANGDCETVADGFVEPVEWRDAGALGHPANGGLIPLTIGVSKKDPWGTEYGYCGWDHGASNSATDAGCGGAGQKRLSGTNSTAFPVVAMVSAGPDKVFTTTCRTFLAADVNADGDLDDAGVDLPLVSKAAETDDDLIFTYTYEEATGASGGLWSLKSGDASTATINKDIEVSGTGTFDRIGATGSDYLEMLSGLKLPNPSVMATCNATNAGVMRLNASATGIEICDGVSAWNEVTGSGGGGGGGSGINLSLSPVNSTGMDVVNGNPTCVSGTCYGSNVTFTLTNNLDPAAASAVLSVTLSNTTDFEKVSDNCHGNSIAAGANCQIVVRAKASGNRSYTATLSITGNNSPLATLSGTSSGFGCTIGGNGPGGKYAGCGVSGYNLIVTPSGCAAGTSNPVCAGGSDTLAMAYGNGPGEEVANLASLSNGIQNNVNAIAYAYAAAPFSAIAHCMNLEYGGYNDWYLPSSQELWNYFWPNRVTLGWSGGAGYWSSAGGSSSSWLMVDAAGANTNYYFSTNRVRCMRKDPPVTFPSPTTDTTPASVTFSPSSSTTAAETRTSNTVTVSGVTQPVTLSVSGGSGAQFSKNGGAYTSTPTTVTNGDQVTLRATSPVAGQEDQVTATVGTSSWPWKVRTVGNNTIYAFVTSGTWNGNLGGLAGADTKCNTEAAAAGLGGSWIAGVAMASGSSTGGPVYRIPWNWTTLKNMNNATVATSWNDLADGTIAAPINRTASNGAPTASYVWTASADPATGHHDPSGKSGDVLCSSWTSTSGTVSFGTINSTIAHFAAWGVYGSCTGSYALYCFQDPGAGLVDTNPNDVSLAPGVAFSAGAAALSNVVTVTGILQPVTVTVTPSAGTVNILLNGVAQGAGPVTAPPNSTLQFSLTVPAVLGTKNTATIAIGDDSYSWWAGYADSSKQARIFATSSTSRPNFAGVVGADTVCNSLAVSSSLGLSAKWKAVISDASTNAADRIPWNWGTLKDVTGTTIVSGGFPDLWDGTLITPIQRDENGSLLASTNVVTGSLSSGTKDTAWSGVQTYPYCNGYTSQSGTPGVKMGNTGAFNSGWIASSNGWCDFNGRIYCFEDIDDTSDTTPNSLSIPYAIQVATSSRQSSSAVLISGMSSGATTTLSVTATGGNPKFTVNGGAEVDSASVTNGDSIVFKMDAPAGANASNKMTITAGSMTSYWRVWTGWDGVGSGIKRVFVTSAIYSAGTTDFVAVTGADARCQTVATAAALGGTWKAIISGATLENNAAVNRVGYNWSELRTVTGTTVVYAPNLWKAATIPLLSPIIVNQNGTNSADAFGVYSNTKADGSAYSTATDGSNCLDWTTNSTVYSPPITGVQSASNGAWINNGAVLSGCGTSGSGKHLYCIEQ